LVFTVIKAITPNTAEVATKCIEIGKETPADIQSTAAALAPAEQPVVNVYIR